MFSYFLLLSAFLTCGDAAEEVKAESRHLQAVARISDHTVEVGGDDVDRRTITVRFTPPTPFPGDARVSLNITTPTSTGCDFAPKLEVISVTRPDKDGFWFNRLSKKKESYTKRKKTSEICHLGIERFPGDVVTEMIEIQIGNVMFKNVESGEFRIQYYSAPGENTPPRLLADTKASAGTQTGNTGSGTGNTGSGNVTDGETDSGTKGASAMHTIAFLIALSEF